MLFLDEYDVPLQSAYVNKYYEQGITFLKHSMVQHLKTTHT